MKLFVLATLIAIAVTPAFADAAQPSPQSKPPTVEELTKQVNFLNAALAAVIQQRNTAQEQLLNVQAQDAATAATTAKSPAEPERRH